MQITFLIIAIFIIVFLLLKALQLLEEGGRNCVRVRSETRGSAGGDQVSVCLVDAHSMQQDIVRTDFSGIHPPGKTPHCIPLSLQGPMQILRSKQDMLCHWSTKTGLEGQLIRFGVPHFRGRQTRALASQLDFPQWFLVNSCWCYFLLSTTDGNFPFQTGGFLFTLVVIEGVLFPLQSLQNYQYLSLYTPSSPSLTHCPFLPCDGNSITNRIYSPLRGDSNMLPITLPKQTPFLLHRKGLTIPQQESLNISYLKTRQQQQQNVFYL